jgi:hypothetical protein
MCLSLVSHVQLSRFEGKTGLNLTDIEGTQSKHARHVAAPSRGFGMVLGPNSLL